MNDAAAAGGRAVSAVGHSIANVIFNDGTNSEDGAKGVKTPEDLINDEHTTDGRETRGRADQYNRPGGRDQRDKEFDSLNPQNVEDRGRGTKTGTLPDGRRVNIHDSKTDGVPTIEVGNGKRDTKIRYPKKE